MKPIFIFILALASHQLSAQNTAQTDSTMICTVSFVGKQRVPLYPDTTGVNQKRAKDYKAYEFAINAALKVELDYTREITFLGDKIFISENVPSQRHLGLSFVGSHEIAINKSLEIAHISEKPSNNQCFLQLENEPFFDTGNFKKMLTMDSCKEARSADSTKTIWYNWRINKFPTAQVNNVPVSVLEYSDYNGNTLVLTKIECRKKSISEFKAHFKDLKKLSKKEKSKLKPLSKYLGKVQAVIRQ